MQSFNKPSCYRFLSFRLLPLSWAVVVRGTSATNCLSSAPKNYTTHGFLSSYILCLKLVMISPSQVKMTPIAYHVMWGKEIVIASEKLVRRK